MIFCVQMNCDYPYIEVLGNCTLTFFQTNSVVVQILLFPFGICFGIFTVLYCVLVFLNVKNWSSTSNYLIASNFLFLASSLTSTIVLFSGLGTNVGLDQAKGRNEYFLICIGSNFMFDGTVFSNLVIAITILPESFISQELKRLTIFTGIGLFMLVIVFAVLIYGRFTTTVSSFYRSLVLVSVVVLVSHIYHFNYILSAVIEFFGVAVPTTQDTNSTVLHSPAMTKENRFVYRQLQKINRFRSRIIVAVSALLLSIMILFTIPGLFDVPVLLFSYTLFLYFVNLIGLGTYFWLNHNASQQINKTVLAK